MDIFASYLERIGGKNPYGKPMFRLVWGGDATRVAYGHTDTGKKGQHVFLKYSGIPAWFLEFWNPPEKYGTAEDWYAKSWDAVAGMHTCGDYPFLGDYEMVAQFYTKERVNGKLEIVTLPLTMQVLDDLVKRVLKVRDMSLEMRRQLIEAQMEAERKESARIAHDAYVDASPAFGGVAGTYTSNREKLLERLNLRLTADQVKPGSRQDEQRWAKEQLKNQEIV